MSTKNFQISSSNDISLFLNKFLFGEISISDFKTILKDYIQIDYSSAPRVRKILKISIDSSIKIPVKKEHLLKMLKKFQLNEISDVDVSNWASLIFMLPCFIPEGSTEEEQWEAGEGPVWIVLQQLAVPEIFDGLDYIIAGNLIDKLST